MCFIIVQILFPDQSICRSMVFCKCIQGIWQTEVSQHNLHWCDNFVSGNMLLLDPQFCQCCAVKNLCIRNGFLQFNGKTLEVLTILRLESFWISSLTLPRNYHFCNSLGSCKAVKIGLDQVFLLNYRANVSNIVDLSYHFCTTSFK